MGVTVRYRPISGLSPINGTVQNDEERVFAGFQAPVVLPVQREGAADSAWGKGDWSTSKLGMRERASIQGFSCYIVDG